MGVRYTTEVLGEGNHASLLIPDSVLAELGPTLAPSLGTCQALFFNVNLAEKI